MTDWCLLRRVLVRRLPSRRAMFLHVHVHVTKLTNMVCRMAPQDFGLSCVAGHWSCIFLSSRLRPGPERISYRALASQLRLWRYCRGSPAWPAVRARGCKGTDARASHGTWHGIAVQRTEPGLPGVDCAGMAAETVRVVTLCRRIATYLAQWLKHQSFGGT